MCHHKEQMFARFFIRKFSTAFRGSSGGGDGREPFVRALNFVVGFATGMTVNKTYFIHSG
jgi:hypothetical protein